MLLAAALAALADVVVFALLAATGMRLEFAQAGSYAAAVALGLLLLRRAPRTAMTAGRGCRLRAAEAALVIALAYVLRAGVLALFTREFGWRADLAIVPAAVTGVAVALASLPWLLRGAARSSASLRLATALTIVCLLALRLVYHAQLELLPQEAYYWNYAQHLDIGYLDHPPLVAWLIAAVTLGGQGEFLVRLPAVMCWLVMLGFAALYARDIAGGPNALRTALLAATLPYFFVLGTMTTPDSPLAAAWAASLYFLRRALVDGEDRAWLPAGVAIGVGMMSKYSMALVPFAAIVFALLDSRSRRVLVSPWAWGGAALALAIFSPVLAWNLRHDFASFAFQGSRRLADEAGKPTLHVLAASVLLLLTPWGIAGAARIVARVRAAAARPGSADEAARLGGRNGRFVLTFTLAPFLVFAVASLWSETKLHWTGPIWLAALPALAASFALPRTQAGLRPIDRFLARSFGPLVHGLTLAYAVALFYYPVYGFAGLRHHHHYLQMGWRDLRAQVQTIEDEVMRETGRRPAVVGLDKHDTADEMAFYDPRGDGAVDTASRHLFYADAHTLMYQWWTPRELYAGRDLIVVGRRRGDLDEVPIAAHATRLGPVRTLVAHKAGDPVGRYHARVVYGYRPAPAPP